MDLALDPVAVWTARLVLAAVFGAGAIAKLRALEEFVGVVHNYRILPASLVRPVAYGLPALELAIALGLVIGPLRRRPQRLRCYSCRVCARHGREPRTRPGTHRLRLLRRGAAAAPELGLGSSEPRAGRPGAGRIAAITPGAVVRSARPRDDRGRHGERAAALRRLQPAAGNELPRRRRGEATR